MIMSSTLDKTRSILPAEGKKKRLWESVDVNRKGEFHEEPHGEARALFSSLSVLILMKKYQLVDMHSSPEVKR